MSNTVSTLLGAQEGIVKFEKMARLSPLGAGGRGEVYKARDTRLEESPAGPNRLQTPIDRWFSADQPRRAA